MNQILDTKVIYVTPKLKRKKKFYKLNFIISIFLVCLLSSYYIYAEYDKTKSEAIAKQMLEETSFGKVNGTAGEPDDEPMMVILDEREYSFEEELIVTSYNKIQRDGDGSETIATIEIPKINLKYPILAKSTPELLKISPGKFWGANPNEKGNFCIAGHNYRNEKFFSKVPTLVSGDLIHITDMYGTTLTYKVFDMYDVEPTDISCLEPRKDGKKEITLITCTNDNKRRVIVKAIEV